MRIRCLLVAAALSACGGDEATKLVQVVDAGTDAAKVTTKRDAGHDAGHDSGKPAAIGGNGGSDEPEGGSGGMPTGGMVAGGSGGSTVDPNPPPEGGKGGAVSEPMGGSAAPVEHVLWSQEWSVEVHEAKAYGAAEGDTMGLVLDAGQGCRFGQAGAASGSTRTFETDGKCITAFSGPTGFAAFFGTDGKTSGNLGRAELVGWKEAVNGHTIKSLRRSQTYTIQLLGSGSETWNYVPEFHGTWEALGF
jgi:hypothetical protein